MFSFHSVVYSYMNLASERLNEMFSQSSYKCDFRADATLTEVLKVSLQFSDNIFIAVD